MTSPPVPVAAHVVGNVFVTQYYTILHNSPRLVHRFYKDFSKLGRPEEDGSMTITTTKQAINDKIIEHNYGDLKTEIKSVDSQESFNGGVHILVTGNLTGKGFVQSFFLAPQERGYFVLNDMLRYVDNVVAAEPVEENHVFEQTTPSAEEAVSGEVYNAPKNGDVQITEEEEEEDDDELEELDEDELDDDDDDDELEELDDDDDEEEEEAPVPVPKAVDVVHDNSKPVEEEEAPVPKAVDVVHFNSKPVEEEEEAPVLEVVDVVHDNSEPVEEEAPVPEVVDVVRNNSEPVEEEEAPVPEVVDVVHDNSEPVVESPAKSDDALNNEWVLISNF